MGQIAIVEVDGKKQYQYIDSYDIVDAQLSPQQANYDPLGATTTQGCANCNWFLPPGRCVVVSGEISPTGNSDLWMAEAPSVSTPILVQVVDASGSPLTFAGAKDTLTAKKRNALGSSQFAYVDSDGKGHLPINDEAHVRAAMSRWNQTSFATAGDKSAAKRKIAAAAKRYGIDASGFTGSKDADSVDVVANGSGRGSALDRILSAVKSAVLGAVEDGAALGNPVLSNRPFTLVTQKDGRVRFMAAWSNNFEDREREIFPEYAHKEFIDWADTNQQYPELWLWHTKGTKYGQVDWLDYTDGFVYASGLIDPGFEPLAEMLAKEDSGVSHGFAGLQRGKEIIQYRSFEISTLPRTNAAVWTTSFNIIGDGAKEMAFTATKRDYLKAHGLDDTAIAAAEKQATDLSTSLKSLGIAWKDSDLVVEEVKAAKPKPDPDQADDDAEAAAAAKKKAGAKDGNDIQLELADLLRKNTEAIVALAGTVKAIDDRVKSVEQTDDAKIAAAMTARAPATTTAVAASKSADNVVGEQQMSNDKEFFDKTFLASLGVGPAAAVA